MRVEHFFMNALKFLFPGVWSGDSKRGEPCLVKFIIPYVNA